jgi:hypothetical protein
MGMLSEQPAKYLSSETQYEYSPLTLSLKQFFCYTRSYLYSDRLLAYLSKHTCLEKWHSKLLDTFLSFLIQLFKLIH